MKLISVLKPREGQASNPRGCTVLASAVMILMSWGSVGAQECPTSIDPADTSCLSPIENVETAAAAAYSGPPLRIAYINDNNFDLSGFRSVQSVVSAQGLGTVQRLFIQDVLNGALDTGNYDVVFNARHYNGPSTIGGNPFTRVPTGLDDALDRALQRGIGVITEWQGGSPMWSALPAPGTATHYYQMTDTNGALWNWFQGTVDRGDSGWLNRLFTTVDPAHPVMAGIDPAFSIGGVEFCYRIQNLDTSLDVLATLTERNTGQVRPAIMAGRRFSGNVVIWPCDWGDNRARDANVRKWIENAILFAANPVLEVPINIKPGSDPNSINLCSGGNTPVTIFGSDTVDAALLDPDSLRFASAEVKTVGKSDRSLCSVADVGAPDPMYFDGLDPNPDGFADLTCHFLTEQLVDLDDTSTTADVMGSGCDYPYDIDGCQPGDTGFFEVIGTDSVNIVKDCP